MIPPLCGGIIRKRESTSEWVSTSGGRDDHARGGKGSRNNKNRTSVANDDKSTSRGVAVPLGDRQKGNLATNDGKTHRLAAGAERVTIA